MIEDPAALARAASAAASRQRRAADALVHGDQADLKEMTMTTRVR
jgi:hypothetical protein